MIRALTFDTTSSGCVRRGNLTDISLAFPSFTTKDKASRWRFPWLTTHGACCGERPQASRARSRNYPPGYRRNPPKRHTIIAFYVPCAPSHLQSQHDHSDQFDSTVGGCGTNNSSKRLRCFVDLRMRYKLKIMPLQHNKAFPNCAPKTLAENWFCVSDALA